MGACASSQKQEILTIKPKEAKEAKEAKEGKKEKKEGKEKQYHKVVFSEPNTAQDIAVDTKSNIWIVSTTKGPARGNEIRKFDQDKEQWGPSIGDGVRLTVTPKGYVWVTTDKLEVWVYTGTWARVGHTSYDIGGSANEYVTVVGGLHDIWRNTEGPIERWGICPGIKAKSVAGDPDGNPWIIGIADGYIYRWAKSEHGDSWSSVPGAKATDIGIGKDGTVWIASDKPADGGYEVAMWRPEKGKWKYCHGIGAVRVAVYPNGDLAGVDDAGRVFKLEKPKKK